MVYVTLFGSMEYENKYQYQYDNFIHGCTNLQIFKLGLQSYDHWEFDIHYSKWRV